MRRTLVAASVLAALLGAGSAYAQGTVKIGVILPYSGQFADTGDADRQRHQALHEAARRHRRRQEDRDHPQGFRRRRARRGQAPRAGTVVRDSVDILAGFALTPERACGRRRFRRGEEVHGDHERRDLDHHHQVALSARTSMTLPMVERDLRHLGAQERHQEGLYDGVGLRARPRRRGAFQRAFKAAGGEIIGSVRMPVANPDFSAFVQRAKDLNPESIFIFVPGGAQPAALARRSRSAASTRTRSRSWARAKLTDEQALKSMGDAALGIITAWHYDYNLDSKMNKDFVAALQRRYKRNPDFFSVGGYDGMHLIYEVLKKTGGKTDGDALIAAAKGMTWESPRGPMSIDPETRDVVQTIYIRRVAEGRQRPAQRRVRQDRERQGPGEGRDEEVNRLHAEVRIGRRADHRPPALRYGSWGDTHHASQARIARDRIRHARLRG